MTEHRYRKTSHRTRLVHDQSRPCFTCQFSPCRCVTIPSGTLRAGEPVRLGWNVRSLPPDRSEPPLKPGNATPYDPCTCCGGLPCRCGRKQVLESLRALAQEYGYQAEGRSEPPSGYYVSGQNDSWHWEGPRSGQGCTHGNCPRTRAEAVAACWAEYDKQSAGEQCVKALAEAQKPEPAPFEVGQAVVCVDATGQEPYVRESAVYVVEKNRVAFGRGYLDVSNGVVAATHRFRPLDLSRLQPCKPCELKAGDRVVALRRTDCLKVGHVYTVTNPRPTRTDDKWVQVQLVPDGEGVYDHDHFARLPEVEPAQPDAFGLLHDRPVKSSGVSRPAQSTKVPPEPEWVPPESWRVRDGSYHRRHFRHESGAQVWQPDTDEPVRYRSEAGDGVCDGHAPSLAQAMGAALGATLRSCNPSNSCWAASGAGREIHAFTAELAARAFVEARG